MNTGVLPEGVISGETKISFLSTTKIKLTTQIPTQWLLAQNRAYPVVFDPSISIGGTGQLSYSSSGFGFRYPWRTNYWQAVDQTIYLQSEINQAGNITAIAYKQGINNGLANSNATIRWQTTNNSTFPTTSFVTSGWNQGLSSTTLDYTNGSGTSVNCSNPDPQWRTIDNTTGFIPFYYNNTQNLIIETRFQNTMSSTNNGICGNISGSCCIGGGWYYYDRSGTVTVHGKCDCTNSYPPAPENTYNYRSPVIQLTIQPTQQQYTITTSSSPTNGGTTSGDGTYNSGASVTVNASANIGWTFVNWTENGTPVSSNSSYPITVTTNRILVANFTQSTQQQYSIITSSNPNNAGTTGGNGTYNSGANVTVVATANSGWTFTNWTENGTPVSTNSSYLFSVTGNRTLVANFSQSTQSQHIITTSSNPATGGSTLGGGVYSSGTPITVRAYANTGWTFVNWTENGNPVYSNVTYSFSVTSDRTLVANFTRRTQQKYTISTSSNPTNGGITSGGGTFSSGTSVTVKATANSEWNFVDWTENGRQVSTISSYPLTATSNRTLVANFVTAPSITINNNASLVPPWQREGDELAGSITASYVNIPDIYVDGKYATPTTVTWATTSTSGTHRFDLNLDPSKLKPVPTNGSIIVYQLINNTTRAHDDVSQKTKIIEKKWDKQNVIFYNSGNNQLLIPLKYFSNCISTTISFSRENHASHETDNIITVPTVQLGNEKYFILDNTNSLLSTTSPGVFNYTLKYNPSAFYQEAGVVDLTKIGKLGGYSFRNDTLIVIIGGNRNTIEKDIQFLNKQTNPAGTPDKDFSIAQNFRLGIAGSINANYNTWYIAQSNTNYFENNAYDIALALDSIIAINNKNNSFPSQIHLVSHSFGGLQVRTMLTNMGRKNDGSSGVISSSSLDKIKSVIFLSSPHQGIAAGSWQWVDGNAYQQAKINSKFFLDLTQKTYPSNINFLNIAGIDDSYPLPSDGIVDAWSSQNPFLRNNLGNQILVSQLYVKKWIGGGLYNPLNPILSIAHSMTHHTDITSDNSYSIPNDYSTLNRIFAFVRRQFPIRAEVQIHGIDIISHNIGSILSGSKFYIKYLGEQDFHQKNIFDENGVASISFFPTLQIGDSIKIEAAGYETQILPIDSSIITSRKLQTCLFKSSTPTSKVKYASLSLPNNNSITNNGRIQLKVTAKNASKLLLNQRNTDTSFIAVVPINDLITVNLDTGYNKIIVKYIGSDTVVQMKKVFYYPDSLISQTTYNLLVHANSTTFGSKMYINNQFVKEVLNLTTTIPALVGRNEIKFTKFGYKSSLLTVDSATALSVAGLLTPYSYSSFSDSSIYNFSNELNPQYWKNISLKNISSTSNIQISAKQYDDSFAGKGLKPQCRKFVFRNTGSLNAKLRTAIALDQIETPDSNSVYLLSIRNGKYTKYEANKPNVTEYDPEVQKLAFDSISIAPGETQEIVLMKKQAPIMKSPSITLTSGDSIVLPLKTFVADPDSIKGDIDLVLNNLNPSNSQALVAVRDNVVVIKTKRGFTGILNFDLNATHDFITLNNSYSIKVLAPTIPTNKLIVFPNPAHNYVDVEYNIDLLPFHVRLNMYDIQGKLLKTIVDEIQYPGYRHYTIPIDYLAEGTYVLDLSRGLRAKFIKQ